MRPGNGARRIPGRPLRGGVPAVLAAALLLAGPLFPHPGSAQTILNIERFQFGELDGAHGAAEVAASGQLGNVRFLEIALEGVLGYAGSRHWPRAIVGGWFLSEEGEDAILDDRFLQLRYSYILSPRARTFHFLQLQRNETYRLQSRWLLGSGARRTVVGGDRGSLDVGTGIMREEERLDSGALGPDDDPRTRTWRAANLVSGLYELPPGAQVWNVAYVQPDVTDPGDFRLLNELFLVLPLGNSSTVTMGVDWRHDSRPPGGLKRNDLSFRTGIGVSF